MVFDGYHSIAKSMMRMAFKVTASSPVGYSSTITFPGITPKNKSEEQSCPPLLILKAVGWTTAFLHRPQS
jgi:hypothetical protein